MILFHCSRARLVGEKKAGTDPLGIITKKVKQWGPSGRFASAGLDPVASAGKISTPSLAAFCCDASHSLTSDC